MWPVQQRAAECGRNCPPAGRSPTPTPCFDALLCRHRTQCVCAFLISFNNDFMQNTVSVTSPDFDGLALISSIHDIADFGDGIPKLCAGRRIYLKGIHDLSRRFPGNGKITSFRTLTKVALIRRWRIEERATGNGKRKRHSAKKAEFHRPHPIDQPRRALRAEDWQSQPAMACQALAARAVGQRSHSPANHHVN